MQGKEYYVYSPENWGVFTESKAEQAEGTGYSHQDDSKVRGKVLGLRSQPIAWWKSKSEVLQV